MATEQRTALEQLEDALLKVGPAGGGVIGGLMGAGMLKDVTHPLVGFIAGGAVGGCIIYAILYGFFRLMNPKRDRSKNK